MSKSWRWRESARSWSPWSVRVELWDLAFRFCMLLHGISEHGKVGTSKLQDSTIYEIPNYALGLSHENASYHDSRIQGQDGKSQRGTSRRITVTRPCQAPGRYDPIRLVACEFTNTWQLAASPTGSPPTTAPPAPTINRASISSYTSSISTLHATELPIAP